LLIGEVYEVPCAELRWDDGRIYLIPVIDHYHADPQFGFPDQHYHIDGRFEMEPRMRHHFRVTDGRTSAVIVKRCGTYELIAVVKKWVKCTGTITGLRLPESGDNAALYQHWYESYVGQLCKGRRCPHFGTEMLETGGKLVCPMHHLVADRNSLKVLPFTTAAK
jgi:hypothetical protein